MSKVEWKSHCEEFPSLSMDGGTNGVQREKKIDANNVNRVCCQKIIQWRVQKKKVWGWPTKSFPSPNLYVGKNLLSVRSNVVIAYTTYSKGWSDSANSRQYTFDILSSDERKALSGRSRCIVVHIETEEMQGSTQDLHDSGACKLTYGIACLGAA